MSAFFRPPKDPVLSDKAEKDIEKAQKIADVMGHSQRYRYDGASMILRGVPPCPFCGCTKADIRMRMNLDLDQPRVFKTVRCGWCGAGTHENALPVRWHVIGWCRRVTP